MNWALRKRRLRVDTPFSDPHPPLLSLAFGDLAHGASSCARDDDASRANPPHPTDRAYEASSIPIAVPVKTFLGEAKMRPSVVSPK